MSSFVFYIKKENKFLLFLFLFSFFIRALFFITFLSEEKKYWVCKDSAEYYNVAVQIAQGNGISNANGELSFYRVPGYSLFLVFFHNLFSGDTKKTLWIQIFLSSFIPLLTFFLALILFIDNFLLAKISSIYMAISLNAVLHSGLLMTDSLFLLFFLIFLLLFFSGSDLFFCKNKAVNFSLKKMFLAGFFLGISSLIRPVGHFVIIVSVVLLFFSNFNFFQKIKNNFYLILGWLFVVSWWLLRNFIFTGSIFFHTMPGVHFLTYFAAEVASQANYCTYGESKNRLFKKLDKICIKWEKKNNKRIGELEYGNLAQKMAIDTLRQYPLISIKHCFVNIFKTCFSLVSSFFLFLCNSSLPSYDGSTSLWQKIKYNLFPNVPNKKFLFFVYYEIILLFIVMFGFLVTLICSIFDKKLLCKVLKCLPFIILFILMTFGSGVARLRLPIEPILVIFSFYFWINLFKRKLFRWAF